MEFCRSIEKAPFFQNRISHVGRSKTLNGTFGGVWQELKLKHNSIIIAVTGENIIQRKKALTFCSPFTCT